MGLQRWGRGAQAALVAATILLSIAPTAVDAHGDQKHASPRLLENAGQLMFGPYEGPQAGPLVIAPYRAGPLACGSPEAADYLLRAGLHAAFAVVGNATHVSVSFVLDAPGYLGFAFDTHDAVRTLILMEENAVVLHWLVAFGVDPKNASDGPRAFSGELGVPHALPTSGGGMKHGTQEASMFLAHDVELPASLFCVDATGDYVGFVLPRDSLPGVLEPGRLVHAVALHDPDTDLLLPRPIETTSVAQMTFYLARPGEEPSMLQRALDPGTGVHDWLPLGLLGAAYVVASLRVSGPLRRAA